MMIRELDTVRVLRLFEPKLVDGSASAVRSPEIGDTGTVVAVRETDWGDTIYTVERVSPDGRTEWLADFWRAEIEPHPRTA